MDLLAQTAYALSKKRTNSMAKTHVDENVVRLVAGQVVVLTVFFLFVFDAHYPALVVGGILVFCAVLESVFKVCLGCYAYNWMVIPITNKLQK